MIHIAKRRFKVDVPLPGKYRLLGALQCAAKPTRPYATNRRQKVELMTGLVFAGSIYNWDTTLPAGLIIEIVKFYHYRGCEPMIRFVIKPEHNHGWCYLSCYCELKRLNTILLEEI